MDNLTATTARPVLLRSEVSEQTRRVPAGTEVYARPRRDGRGLMIRLPGTLFAQHVTADALLIP